MFCICAFWVTRVKIKLKGRTTQNWLVFLKWVLSHDN